jgi:ribonuclease Y
MIGNGGLVLWVLGMVITLAIGLGLGYFFRQQQFQRSARDREAETEKILEEARAAARVIELKARDDALRLRDEGEAEASRRRAELNREDERLQRRRAELDSRVDQLEKRDQALSKRQSAVDKRANEIDKLHDDTLAELQRVAEMSQDEAKGQLLAEVERESRNDMARIIRQIEEEAQAEGDRRARELIADAIQRVASEHVAEITVTVVPLPSDELKGRIIGLDVVVDDTPEAVTISSFDPVRREVARRSMERLVEDGRIHPAHIEKIVETVRVDVDRLIVEAGEQASFDAGVPGLHPEILKKLGRLKFRTSYGQNQLAHAVETAQLAGVIASELRADPEIAKAGGLLHDLGKAMDHEVEGTHASIGAEFCRRHGVSPAVVNIVGSHNHEVDQESVEAVIVVAADAISGARPGARRENLEQYIKRVRGLEDIANSFTGVSQSYALQAGREVRVIVQPEEIDDLDATRLARDVARKIEEGIQYPGQIKVTVIRETRAVDYAK